MNLVHLFNSDAGLTLIGGAIGFAWTAFRSLDAFRAMRSQRHEEALRALEAGVEETYRTYVREIKRARADGALTRDEIRRARNKARYAALRFGASRGVDVMRELGGEFIEYWITRAVRRAKTE